MAKTDLLGEDYAEWDEELANACGFSEDDEGFDPFEMPWNQFNYTLDVYECQGYDCHGESVDENGPRYYYKEEVNTYTEEKPKTLREQKLDEIKAQVDAGQLSLWDWWGIEYNPTMTQIEFEHKYYGRPDEHKEDDR